VRAVRRADRLARAGPTWSPIGAAANVALDVSTPAFGIQEATLWLDAVHDVFPRADAARRLALPSDQPGWGIDLDEAAARGFPRLPTCTKRWSARVRRPDGGIEAP